MRKAPRKRFYAEAGVIEAAGGFAITLDDKGVRTPSGRQLVAPTREIADAIAAEFAVRLTDGLATRRTRKKAAVTPEKIERSRGQAQS